MSSKPQVQSTGPASDLIARIQHLASLLHNLPETLPLNPPETRYHFAFDPNNVCDEGLYYAFNRNLEICFGTHELVGGKIPLTQRGTCYENLIKMFKKVAKDVPEERKFLREHWLERLIRAAHHAGARIPDKYDIAFHNQISADDGIGDQTPN
jgi:hypothetical protein